MSNQSTLIVMRHAKAEPWQMGQLDIDRPLNPRGFSDAPRMGQWLAEQGCCPDQALVSPACRTLMTWSGFCQGLGATPPMEVVPRIYEASIHTLLGLIQGQTAPCVMLVGHNPACEELVRYLVCEGDLKHDFAKVMPTAAAYVLTFDLPWSEIGAGTARVVAHARPKNFQDGAFAG